MVDTKNDDSSLAQSKDEEKVSEKTQRFILWISPSNKKLQYNQFHVEAKDLVDARKQLEETADFNYKIVGVSDYEKLGKKETNKFKNKTFY